MITDKLENSALYAGLGENIAKALNYLQSTNFMDMEPGKYEIEGEDIFAMVSDYTTKPKEEGRLEAHRNYLDVQFLAKGTELIGYAPLANQEPSTEYDQQSDLIFYKGQASFTKMEPGIFAIYFPTDLHMPCIQAEGPASVRKVVVKVRV